MIVFTLFTFLVWQCGKKEPEGEPADLLSPHCIVFILTDSTGQNVLPQNLPEDPVVDPFSFQAFSELSSITNIGTTEISTTAIIDGYYFKTSEFPNISERDLIGEDTTYTLCICFSNFCDTVLLPFKKNLKVIWGKDTINDYAFGELLQVQNYRTEQQKLTHR